MNCPNCGTAIQEFALLDSEYCAAYYDTFVGTCPNCGKSWRWIEVYTFNRIDDIEEIKRNDHL